MLLSEVLRKGNEIFIARKIDKETSVPYNFAKGRLCLTDPQSTINETRPISVSALPGVCKIALLTVVLTLQRASFVNGRWVVGLRDTCPL